MVTPLGSFDEMGKFDNTSATSVPPCSADIYFCKAEGKISSRVRRTPKEVLARLETHGLVKSIY